MQLSTYKIERLQELNALLTKENSTLQSICKQAEISNKWFTAKHIWKSITAIKDNYLDAEKLEEWLSKYPFSEVNKTVGIILAGNIPLVGFHDVLCAFVVNTPTQIKLSSKDTVLMTYIVNVLAEIDITWKVNIVERLENYDAIIATGSNNTNRYFEQYFSHVPNILRNNRHSIAVLNGRETDEELYALASDIFQYFGLGCRNISYLFIPENYDIKKLFPYFDQYKHYINHNLYKDNYDYSRTLLLMNKDEHLANDFVIVKEDKNIHSRLATIHYAYYKTEDDIVNYLLDNNKHIQAIVSKQNEEWKHVPFGKAQEPSLEDYADHVDTLAFLLDLS